MRNFYTLICVGFICSTGWTAYAQSLDPMEALIQTLSDSGTVSVDRIFQDVKTDILDTTTSERVSTTLDGPLVVTEVIPEANKIAITFTDSRTGRYTPKLKINFAEFPLRSLADTNRSNGNRIVQNNTQAEIVARRIQDRFRVPDFDLIIADRTAVLSGTVETERQRSLIESMIRFEPGISTVRNELRVNP